MSLYFILKMAGDLSLLYAAANAFFCMTSCDVSFLPLLVLSCCGGLGLFLNSKKPILRYLALLPAPLAFFGVNSTFTGVIILISVGYLAVIVHRQNFALTYDDRLGFLSLSIKVLVACLIPILTFAWGELAALYPVCHPAVYLHPHPDAGAAPRSQRLFAAQIPHRRPAVFGSAGTAGRSLLLLVVYQSAAPAAVSVLPLGHRSDHHAGCPGGRRGFDASLQSLAG